MTTVAGLAVAIPAVIAYNHFVGELNLVSGELEGFSSEFIGTLAREGSFMIKIRAELLVEPLENGVCEFDRNSASESYQP
ncbi:MAG: hypothetical protein CM1200mP14_28730 [Gammaproteobacteria bacterium]|nr:MAG: hypothetical protein CM1200mP14_28730 [Gammaproteobacteria bacterium]